MHMRIDKPRHHETVTIIRHLRLRMGCAQGIGGARCDHLSRVDQHGAVPVMAGSGLSRLERVTGEGQNLPQDQIGHAFSFVVAR